jgi:hypothetical protein
LRCRADYRRLGSEGWLNEREPGVSAGALV